MGEIVVNSRVVACLCSLAGNRPQSATLNSCGTLARILRNTAMK